MGFSWTFIGHSTSDFICSLSEAQKGAEDRGQIKAQLGGMPVRCSWVMGHCYINIIPVVDEAKNKTSLRSSSLLLRVLLAIGRGGLFMGFLIFAIFASILLLPYLLGLVVDPQ